MEHDKLSPAAIEFPGDFPEAKKAERERIRALIARAEREIGELEGEITRRKSRIASLREEFSRI